MDKIESLNHTKWDCKYHAIFIPKGRRKVLYRQLRMHLGEMFRGLARHKKPDRGGKSDSRSRAHNDRDTTEVHGIERGGIHQGEKCDSPRTGVRGTKEELCGAKFLGAGVLCFDRWTG